MNNLEPPAVEPFAEYCARIRKGDDYLPQGMYTTVAVGPIARTRKFEDTSTAELRALLQPIREDVGRAQLLALCRNRWSCGYWIETEERLPQRTNEIPA